MLKKIILAGFMSVLLAAPLSAAEMKDAKMPLKPNMDKMITRLDTNKDGVVDEAEFVAQAKTKFAKKDLNKDGKIDKEEFAKSAPKFHGKERMGRKDAKGAKGCQEAKVCKCPMMQGMDNPKEGEPLPEPRE